MKHNIYKTVKAVAPTLLLLLFLLPSCSKENGGEPEIPETKYAKLTITLGGLDNSTPSYTRADGDADNDISGEEDDEEYERHIDDWWIVVVNDGNKNKDKVEQVLSNTLGDVGKQLDDNNNTHEVGVELLIGETYRFYAFANLKHLQNGETVIEELESLVTASKTFSDFRDTEATLLALTEYTNNKQQYIPMSSYMKSKIVSDKETDNNVSLSLIRLLGKVKVEVTNATGNNVTINNITMGKFRQSGSIWLLPYDAAEDDPEKENLLIQQGESDQMLMNPKFPPQTPPVSGSDYVYTPTEQEKTIASTAIPTPYTFYINETDQASVGDNGAYMTIALDVLEFETEKKEPKITDFSFIRRNDLLNIPILISDAEVKIGFEQKHMPIGGVPKRYTFLEGIEIASRTFVTNHAGEVTITYSLEKLNNNTNDWSLKYYKTQDEGGDGEVEGTDHFCYASLEENTKDLNGNGYLIEPETKDQDPLSWWEKSANGHQQQPDCAFPLHPASGAESTTKGSFTINLQELSNTASATIKLVLVAEKDGAEVVLPYTLVVTNKEVKIEGGE
ncbi:hypothetical protein [Parabacteroides chongii]|mgnify:FL=1|uniref:hypothetical protein n=1 Tax=Parabacteroides chongii TaxID=2685834 RepID=UPI00240CFBCE|nr:hypothetical protein [Parabacteroides chongii]WFE83008.1 hypothetical protein P3L47_12690 [Parabacteroides chongii]